MGGVTPSHWRPCCCIAMVNIMVCSVQFDTETELLLSEGSPRIVVRIVEGTTAPIQFTPPPISLMSDVSSPKCMTERS